KKKYSIIGDVRGIGAMRLVEFVKDRDSKTPEPDLTLKIIKDAVAHGIVLIRAGLYSNCIRLLPPLVITEYQLNEGLDVLEAAIARA
ncbi:MAG: aminotransferase class III-fold pyridoxal phosphate-dependent enzyme, partial [Cytophagales bacterium]